MNRNLMKHLGILFLVLSLLLNPVFVTPAYALSAPTLVAPANGTNTTAANTPALAIPEFKWNAVDGATLYHLQVSNEVAFINPIIDITTPNLSYTPPSSSVFFSDGTWYWHVRVEAPAPVSAYSGTWSFNKQWAVNNAPTLTSPANGASLNFYDQPGFSWNAVPGAAKYKLQIYSSPGGWSNLAYPLIFTLETTYQPVIKLANGTYYWRVVPIDAGNHDGTPSVERSFTAGYSFVPTLLAPADGSNPTFTPTFRWTAVRGAQYYELQYATDTTFQQNLTDITTSNTSYTPPTTLPNDVNYYWRVSAHSGSSVSAWSPYRTFLKRWYIQPVLLTPVNSYQNVRFPMFSWTPVPGAARYFVEISKNAGFNPIYDSGYTANTFYSPTHYDGASATFYWRVTPIDGDGRNGKTSNTPSYVSSSTSLAPHQVYPLYYYPPDSYAGFPGVTTNPHEDRAVAVPIFIWHRVYQPALDPNQGQVYAQAYRVQVSTDATFLSVNWTVDTQNTIAAPTAANPFNPTPNIDYYWRVRPLIGGNLAGSWSQIWKVRFDASKGLTPTNGLAPVLIRPTDGFEYAEATPLLEWFPLSGAASYDVQISRDTGFSDIVNSATVTYPAYVPTQALAQRSLGSLDFGIYYWRVRKSPDGAWSETRRFQIAAQSQWQETRTLGDTTNRLQIGSDPAADIAIADADYDLTNLQVAQSSSSWFFGFNVPSSPTHDVMYTLYLDLDHQDGSGATSDARNYNVTTISTFRPEYAIYVLQQGGAYSADTTFLYRWTGGGWDTVSILSDIGGQLNKNGNYVEIQLQNTSIGYQDTTGSYAVSLFSVSPAAGNQPKDSVPSDSNIPGVGPIRRFANVTERLNLLMPPTSAGADPSTYPSIQPFFWDWPILAPWAGATMKAYLDAQFTTEVQPANYSLISDASYYAQTSHAWSNDFNGDNTYFWRVQPRYLPGGIYYGAWSQGWRFERKGFVPQNLSTSVTFATPTFSWDMVEGTEWYQLQISTNQQFNPLVLEVATKQNSYTSQGTFENGTYYWRVSVHRNGNVINNWSTTQNFTLSLPTPTNLSPAPSTIVPRAPTLCWTPLIVNSQDSTPVLAAWKYQVQVSKEPTFTGIFDSTETEQSCWTPTKGYDDGTYYWRVAMIDGQGKFGNYAGGASQTFVKQYPTTTLTSPAPGSKTASTPTFVWTPVDGAARYQLEVSKFATFSPPYETVVTENVRWTPTRTYDNLTTYYWRVAIIDADGRIGPFVGSTIILSDTPKAAISVYIGASGTPVGTYSLDTAQSTRQNYDNLDDGPVKVISTNNVPIVAALRDLWWNGSAYTSSIQLMGLPQSLLSDTYVFPSYNNVNLNDQLRFGNVGNADTTVTVTIGGVVMGNYPLAPNQRQKVNYAGLDSGPVIVKSSNGVPIIASIRDAWINNGVTSSFSQLMGLPQSLLSDTYVFPSYNNISLSDQLRFGNVGNAPTTVTVTIGGVVMGSYDLLPNQRDKASYPGLDSGPVVVHSSNGVPIIASLREAWLNNGVTTSYFQMMGLPQSQLSDKYVFPAYDNVTLSGQLRFGNVGNTDTTVTVTIAGVVKGTYLLGPNQRQKVSYVGLDDGPIVVQSSGGVPIIAALRDAWLVNGVTTSFSQMMGLPGGQISSTYVFPSYNNNTYDNQLRIGVP